VKGAKIRVASPVQADTIRILGGSPVFMGINEVYPNMEKGVIDGCINPWEANTSFKLFELVNQYTMMNMGSNIFCTAMNKKKWDSLPDNVKKVFEETTGMAMSAEAGRVYDETDVPMRNLCVKKGMQVIQFPEEEKKKLEALAKPIRSGWVQEMTAKGYPGQAILEAAIEYTKE
jgi:TRAP-type C4-dicarboxylate transport system substrate-binding protein